MSQHDAAQAYARAQTEPLRTSRTAYAEAILGLLQQKQDIQALNCIFSYSQHIRQKEAAQSPGRKWTSKDVSKSGKQTPKNVMRSSSKKLVTPSTFSESMNFKTSTFT